MAHESFVPPGFRAPTSLVTDAFRLEPLTGEHNEADLAAWSSSVEHIRATPGFPNGSWPPLAGMAPERNLTDLEHHAADFAAGRGFTFTVLEPVNQDVVGCVYLYPDPDPAYDVSVRTWVRTSHAHLDGPLADAVVAWLAGEWPWQRPNRHGR